MISCEQEDNVESIDHRPSMRKMEGSVEETWSINDIKDATILEPFARTPKINIFVLYISGLLADYGLFNVEHENLLSAL